MKLVELNSLPENFDILSAEASKDGHHFLEKMKLDWETGKNQFSRNGEVYYGVFEVSNHNEVIAMGGVNIDPYVDDPTVGRLRHIYVAKKYQRTGAGKFLLRALLSHSRKHFNTVRLRTHNTDAVRFYKTFGFEENLQPNDTAHIYLEKKLHKPTLIVFTGLPASGKTTLAKHVSKALSIPLLSRDAFKEVAFDSLGFSDRTWSKKLGSLSYDLLYMTCQEFMKSGCNLMIESNFEERASAKLASMVNEFQYSILQIHCTASLEALVSRFESRARGHQRHPGHMDLQNLDEMKLAIQSACQQPLYLPGLCKTVVTEHFDSEETHRLMTSLADFLN